MKKQKYRGKRRRMKKFRLSEISFVDTPAQEGATADIQKASVDELLDDDFEKQSPREGESFRAFLRRMRESEPGMSEERARAMFDEGMSKAGDLADLFTSVDEGHQHSIKLYYDDDDEKLCVIVGYAMGPDGEMHDHQVMMTDTGEYMLSENAGHTHTVDQDRMRMLVMNFMLNKNSLDADQVAKGVKDFLTEDNIADLLKRMGDNVQKETENMNDLEKAKGEISTLTAQVATLSKVAALPSDHKAFYDRLDEDGQKDFLEKSVDDQKAQIEKASDEDPVIYTSAQGIEFRKSDDPRFVEMAKQNDAERKRNADLQKKLDDQDLTKRAEDELGHLAGDLDVHKEMLRSIDKIADPEMRKRALEALKSHDNGMSKAMESYGSSGQPNEDDPHQDLNKMAAEYAKENKVSHAVAYRSVLETPEGEKLYAKARQAKH